MPHLVMAKTGVEIIIQIYTLVECTPNDAVLHALIILPIYVVVWQVACHSLPWSLQIKIPFIGLINESIKTVNVKAKLPPRRRFTLSKVQTDLIIVCVVDGQQVIVLGIHVADPEVVCARAVSPEAVEPRDQGAKLVERPVRRPVEREPPELGVELGLDLHRGQSAHHHRGRGGGGRVVEVVHGAAPLAHCTDNFKQSTKG